MGTYQPIGNQADKVSSGDTFTATIKVIDKNKALVNLSTYALSFAVARARSLKQADGPAIITKTIGNGITLGNLGYFTVVLSASDMANLAGNYLYQVRATDALGVVTTLLYGPLEIQGSVL